MNSEKGNILIVILAALVLISTSAVAYLYYQNLQLQELTKPNISNQPMSNSQPTNAPSPIQAKKVDWQIYKNNTENFSISYPDDFSIVLAQKPYYTLDNQVIALMSNKSDYIAPNYVQESIISISTALNIPITGCFQSSNPTITINGTIFHEQKIPGGAAAGNHYDMTEYRTGTNNKCFEITLTVHTSSDWNNIDFTKSDASILAAKNRLQQILSTFQFTK